jgi:hypothetical protein
MDSSVETTGNKGKPSALARDIVRDWERYRDERHKWIQQASENNDFFMGKHYSHQEIVDMKLNGMNPVVVDRIKPIILQEVAIFVATRPTFKALPRDDSDPQIAALWSDVLTWVWQQNDGDSVYQQCVTSYFVKGAGYIFVGIDPYADDGSGEVTMKYLPVWDVYPDPASREIDLSDARSIKISRLIPRSSLKFNYPDQMAKAEAAEGTVGSVNDQPVSNPLPDDGTGGFGFSQNDYSFIDENDDLVRIVENYEKIRVPYWKVFDLNFGTVDVISPEEWNPKDAVEGQQYQKIWKIRIRVTSTIGESQVLYRSVLPTDTYPIIPFYLHHNGTPWVQGDVDIMKGMQRSVNKRHSIMIHNAAQMSNFRWIAQRGSIVNKTGWEETGARSGSILEFNQGYEKPEPVYPGQLPAGWFQLEGLEKEAMEYSVGVFSTMMGSNDGAPDTFRGMLAQEEAGQRKIKFKVQHANHALRRMGKVMLDYCQALYKMPKVMRIAGETNDDYKEVYLNQMGMDPITQKPKKFNDISVGKYDIVAYDGTSMPTNRMAILQMNMELYQLGIIDQEEALKKTDVVNKPALIERMGKAQQLEAQVAQLGESIQDIEGLNQTLRRQLQQAMVKNEATNSSLAIKSQLMQTESEQKLVRARMGDSLQQFQRDLAREQGKVKMQGAGAQAMFKAREHILLNQAKDKGAKDD